jgi:hypothetical protein
MCSDCKELCFCECGILELKETINFMGYTLKSICLCRKCMHEVEVKHFCHELK